MGDAGDVKYRVLLFHGVEPGMIAKRALRAQFVQLHIAFEDYLGVRRYLQVYSFAIHQFHRCLPQKSRDDEFFHFGRCGHDGGKSRGWISTDDHRHFEAAIFAFSDQIAIGVLHAALAHGLKVPDELSIVGFDDTPEAELVMPALTTVRQPLREMGQMAATTLLGMIEQPREHKPGTVITVHPELIIRRG